MRSSLRGLFLLTLTLIRPLSGVAAAKPGASGNAATMEVRETAGSTLTAWPLSAGVPFGKGMVRDATKLRVSMLGKPVPSQSRVLSRWPDGSARWVLMDWQGDLKPEQIASFSVEAATPLAIPRAVRVSETAAAIDVDTGVLRFRIPKTGIGLMTDIKLQGQAATNGAVTCFMVVENKRNECLTASHVRVIDAGPLRARIEIRGRYAAGFAYVVRLDAYAGQPYVRLLHTFEQHSAAPFIAVQQIAIDVPLALAGPLTYRFGIENREPLAGTLPASGVTLAQLDNLEFRLADKAAAGHAAGWATLSGPQSGIALVTRSFWQEYPKSIDLQADRLTYNLWAPQSAAAKIGSGAAKTHELVLQFSDKTTPSTQLLNALGEPPLAVPAAAWMVHSKAMRNAIAPSLDSTAFLKQLDDGYRRSLARGQREAWDDSGEAKCGVTTSERRRRGFYGMLNWGDWNYPGYHDDTKGCDAWGNLEYDGTQVSALAFAATGKPEYGATMIAQARHFMDVDTIHYYDKRPQWVGMNHPKNPLHFSFELGGIDLGHTWTEGLLSYYQLTGDERALAAARGIADHLVARIKRGITNGNPRQWAWPVIALAAMYESSGEEVYRRSAVDYARGGMAQHPPDHISHWKLGILAEALAYADSLQADAAIRSWLTRYAAALTAYSSTPDPRFLPALAYVGRANNKPEYTRAARDGVQRLTFGNWNKPFTIAGRVGFSVLAAGN